MLHNQLRNTHCYIDCSYHGICHIYTVSLHTESLVEYSEKKVSDHFFFLPYTPQGICTLRFTLSKKKKRMNNYIRAF